jgi:hypothetical protein
MPRSKLSPNSSRAARTARTNRWRQRITSQQNQSRQPGQFITSELNNQLDQEQLLVADPVQAALGPSQLTQPTQPTQPTQQTEPTREDNIDPWTPIFDNDNNVQLSPTVGLRRSNRQSSSQAGSRISNYYRVSKSTSPLNISLVTSRLSRTLSAVLQSTEERLIGVENSSHRLSSSSADTISSDGELEEDPGILIKNQLDRELSQSQEGTSNEPRIDIAEELSRHLMRFHGCEINTHNQTSEQHFQDQRRLTNHYSLSDLEAITGQLPDVLGSSKPLEHGSVDQKHPPNWARIFEGRHNEVEEGEEPEEEERIHVCLHKSEQEQRHRPMDIEFDVDSILGYATSLAFAKRGLMINLAPQFPTNIQTNLHLYSHVSHDYGRGPQQVRVKLHEIPHYCLGHLTGQQDTQVYIFFPRQWHPDKQTNFPGKQDGVKHRVLQIWTDKILLPAIAQHVTSGVGQHMPSSWLQARLNAEARYREANGSRIEGMSILQMLHYPLCSEGLDAIWQNIQHRTMEPEYIAYQGAQLFFSCKNQKGVYKGSTLAQVWNKFYTGLEFAFDFQYINEDQFWLDLGKETMCKEWCLPQEELLLNQSPASYLMRSCCLESFYQWSCFNESPSRAKKTLYTPAMLGESYDMTVEMSPVSSKRQEGWIFSQMYNSYKEMTDVAKTKPFRSRFLAQFAWDSKVRALIEQEGGGAPVTAKKVYQGYCQSKNRLSNTLSEGRKKSYGVREEHRITLNFFQRIKRTLETTGNWNQKPDLTLEQYSFWELSSDSYITFLCYSANKFIYAIEWILATAPKGYVSYEHTKVLSMLLQSVKYCYDTSPLAREAGLWKDRYQVEKDGPFIQGMGLEHTIKESGYGWFLPKINWERLTFCPELTREVKYNDLALYDHYRKRWAAVKEVKDDLKRIEQIGSWLELYQTNAQIRDLLIEFLCTIVLQSFRKDVFRGIKDDIQPAYREDALAGKIMLCKTTLENILLPQDNNTDRARIHIVRVNRIKIRTVQQLTDFLWDFDDGQLRTQWDQRSYRSLHQRALDIVRIQCGTAAAARVHDGIKRIFVLTNWVIPYPSQTKFFQRGDRKQRLWLSIYHKDWADIYTADDTIPFSQLCTHLNDDKHRARHYYSIDDDLNMREYRNAQYMGGSWALVEEKVGTSMTALPGESSYFGAQSEVSIVDWGARFEEIWQGATDDLVLD